LQITNDDLGTAREELQSLNEELTTVNEELRQANLELTELNDDLGNLLRNSPESSWRSSDDKSSENQLRLEGPTLLVFRQWKARLRRFLVSQCRWGLQRRFGVIFCAQTFERHSQFHRHL
jgi:hypothetical protein